MLRNKWLFVGILALLSLGQTTLLSGPANAKELSRGPSPANEAVDVAIDTTLSWSPRTSGASYDVYFSAAFTDVDNATRVDPRGTLVSRAQTAAEFQPAALLYGQTYYGRVDEVNATPDKTIFRGDVWSFTAEPYSYPVKPVSVTASRALAGGGPEKTIDGSGLDGNDLHGTDPNTMWLSTSPQKSGADNQAASESWHLAMTLAADFVDQWNGCACSFHCDTKINKRSASTALLAKSAMTSRLRCKMLNHCSTWFIQEQWTGG
jgi:hypothetical protein